MIVLDTHAMVWWVNGSEKLSANAKQAINKEVQSENGVVLVSVISAWEVALLVEHERLTLSMNLDDWLETVSQIDGVRFEPVDVAVALESTRLPGEFHKDPADRMITALARHYNVPLITADKRISSYKHVRTIW